MSRKECKFQLESCFFISSAYFRTFISFPGVLVLSSFESYFYMFVYEVKLQYFSEAVYKLLIIKLKTS